MCPREALPPLAGDRAEGIEAAAASLDGGRYSILLVLPPLWAAITATLAHFTLEALSRRLFR